jgi:putative copper resistance protein D
MMAVLFVQWFRQSQREAVREDRRLDRLEAAEAARASRLRAADHPGTSD